MSENNFFNLIMKDVANHPEVGDLSKLDEKLKAGREARQKLDAANDLRRETAQGINTPRAEYNRLRQEKFNLEQDCRCFETRTNNAAADLKLCQQNIEALLKRKKKAIADGALGEERQIERGLLAHENEQLDFQDALLKQQRYNHSAVQALKNWKQANGARLAELSKEIGA